MLNFILNITSEQYWDPCIGKTAQTNLLYLFISNDGKNIIHSFLPLIGCLDELSLGFVQKPNQSSSLSEISKFSYPEENFAKLKPG